MFRRLWCAAAAAFALGAVHAQPINLKVLGQPVGSGLIQKNKEQPFFEKLAATTGLNVNVQYVPVDVSGIPDTDGLRAAAAATTVPVIASGGVATLADVVALGEVPGIAGVITGKALYEGRFTVAQAVAALTGGGAS